MIKYRFLVLLALSISGWGLEANFNEGKVAIAQTPPQTKTLGFYDQLMKKGYEATRQRNYPLALENFQKALAVRPNDPYASQAIANIQAYLGQTPSSSANPAKTNNSLPLPLIIGSILLTLALAGALISFLSQSRPHRKSHKQTQKNQDRPPSVENFPLEDNGTPFTEPSNYSRFREDEFDPDRDASLPVQATSRIPNADLILQLIGNLRDGDPRTRRRAIWKLAQTSDSRSMQPLVDSMITADSYERSLTLEALAQICTRSLKPMNQALAISLQDKNPQVRKNAIRDLTRLYDIMSQISQLVCHALDDSDEEVQETAKWAIRQLNLQLPPRLDIGPLETTGEAEEEEEIHDTSYTESTEVQS